MRNITLWFFGTEITSNTNVKGKYGLCIKNALTTNSIKFDDIHFFVGLDNTEMAYLDNALSVLYSNGCLKKLFLDNEKNSLRPDQIANITNTLEVLKKVGVKLSNIKIALYDQNKSAYFQKPISALFNQIITSLQDNNVDNTPFYQINDGTRKVLDDLDLALTPFSDHKIAITCRKGIEELKNQTITPDEFILSYKDALKISEQQTINDSIVNAIVFVVRSFLRIFDILYASASGKEKMNDNLKRAPFFTYKPNQEITRRYQKALDKLDKLNLNEGLNNESTNAKIFRWKGTDFV